MTALKVLLIGAILCGGAWANAATIVNGESGNNAWDGPVYSFTSAGPKQITISFQTTVNTFIASDILQVNASFSGQGTANGPTTGQWTIQSASPQTISFSVTITANNPGPEARWAVQPQIFIRNRANSVDFNNIVVQVTE